MHRNNKSAIKICYDIPKFASWNVDVISYFRLIHLRFLLVRYWSCPVSPLKTVMFSGSGKLVALHNKFRPVVTWRISGSRYSKVTRGGAERTFLSSYKKTLFFNRNYSDCSLRQLVGPVEPFRIVVSPCGVYVMSEVEKLIILCDLQLKTYHEIFDEDEMLSNA